MNRFDQRHLHLALIIATAVVISGCGPSHLVREGQQMIDKGEFEVGLSKIREAADVAPRDYRLQYVKTKDETVVKLANRAAQLLSEGKYTQAKQVYEQIMRIDPNGTLGTDGLRAVNSTLEALELVAGAKSLMEAKDRDGATNLLRKALILRPQMLEAQKMLRSLNEVPILPSFSNTLSDQFKKPISIEFRDASVMQIFDIISRTSGLNFIFDREIRGDQRSSIFLKNSTVEAALHFTLLTNQLAYQVLDGNSILIYPNSQQKQKEYQELVIKSFFLKNANANEVATALVALLKAKDVSIDEKTNTIIMRDTAENIRMAEKIISVRDIPEPEVMLEVEVLEIKRSRLQELGIKFPESIALTPLTGGTGTPLTLRDLTNNINSRTTGVTTPNVVVNAKAQDSDVKILANPRIRTKNLESATIQIGERVPNVVTTSTPTFVSESVTYTDVGLKLEVRPRVYLDNDVGINVKLDVSNVVSQSQTKNGATTYQLGTRSAATSLRLKDGETEILAGLINNEDRRTGNKIPLLGDFPLIGRLFGNNVDNSEKTEIVLSITPRIIRNIQTPGLDVAEFSAGTDSGLRVRINSATKSDNATEISPLKMQIPARATSPISIFASPEAEVGEPFTVSLSLNNKAPLARMIYSLKVDPAQFEFIDAKPQIDNTKENNLDVMVQRDTNGQLNVSISPSKGTSFKANGIHTTLRLKPLGKSPQASISVISANAIVPTGEIENPSLPTAVNVTIK